MSESCWNILKIVPTNNESAIKKAYAGQLKHNRPDKNPTGFKRLREAYEQALAIRHYYIDDTTLDINLGTTKANISNVDAGVNADVDTGVNESAM